MNKVRLVIFGLLACIALVAGAVYGIHWWIQEQAVAPFNERITEYLGSTADKGEPAKISGKVIVINETERKMDKDVYFKLPEELRAKTPEEVGTIILVAWTEKTIDQYNNGKPAIQQFANVKVVDKATKEMLGKAMDFEGPPPPMEIKSNSNLNKAPKPIQEVVNYVRGLPKK